MVYIVAGRNETCENVVLELEPLRQLFEQVITLARFTLNREKVLRGFLAKR